MSPKSWIILFVIIIVIMVMIQNMAAIPIKFLFWSFNPPLILIIIVSLMAGFILGYAIFPLLQKRK